MSMGILVRLGRRHLATGRSHRPVSLASGGGWNSRPRIVSCGNPANCNCRVYSQSKDVGDQRLKLHVGFASLTNSLPFSSPNEAPAGCENGSEPTEGLDPLALIMLTALRHGVSSFDCPSPPLIEGNKQLPASCAESSTCWRANRQSEVQISAALDQACDALTSEEANDNDRTPEERRVVSVTCRLGYRSAVVLSDEDIRQGQESEGSSLGSTADSDCQEREGKFEGDARVGVLFAGKAAEENASDSTTVALVHNLSKEYILHSLRTSPLVQQYKQHGDEEDSDDNGCDRGRKEKVRLISLAHNPETQVAAYLLSNHQTHTNDADSTLLEKARAYMRQSLTSAFVGYEMAVEEGLIDGYGVDSNGLSLPESHDMHLGWREVVECAASASLAVHGTAKKSSLTTIRLPGNILEIRGLKVASDMASEIDSFFDACNPGTSFQERISSVTEGKNKSHLQQEQQMQKLQNTLPTRVEVCLTRPLTAYPYGGTGQGPTSTGISNETSSSNTLASTPPLFMKSGDYSSSSDGDGKTIDATNPIRIIDYQIEAGMSVGKEAAPLCWTNDHFHRHGLRPSSYQPILNAVLSHFDAEAILEASRERELTVEERETLDGCKLLQGMVHDLDASLDSMKSFAAYEHYLLKVAVPLIHGSFEALDEESAGMLQLFFRVHGMAVRMVVARWTRDLLLAGKGQSEVWEKLGFEDFTGVDVPEDITLQEFSFKCFLKNDAVQGLVLGCSRPEHVLEVLEALRADDSR